MHVSGLLPTRAYADAAASVEKNFSLSGAEDGVRPFTTQTSRRGLMLGSRAFLVWAMALLPGASVIVHNLYPRSQSGGP